MGRAVQVKFDTEEFTSTLKKYASLSKRTPAEICNRKAYMINRRAIWHTKKADAQRIKEELGGAEAFELHLNKSGKNKGKFSQSKKHATFAFNRTASGAAGRFERIIVARLKKAGKAIPNAQELAAYLVRAFKARLRSVAFIKSGFIPARDAFKAWCISHGVSIGKAGLPSQEGAGIGGPKQIGAKKGGARPANFNWIASATFFNAAAGKHGPKKDALIHFGGEGLQRAFAEETADTLEEIERRLKQHAHTCGIKTS